VLASIIHDVIGPVTRGPVNPHCAAARRIGRLARDLMGGAFDEVLVDFDRNSSLPTTHKPQGSDRRLGAGLMEVKSSMGSMWPRPRRERPCQPAPPLSRADWELPEPWESPPPPSARPGFRHVQKADSYR